MQTPIFEREKTHGDFFSNAIITQSLKSTLREQSNWEHLTAIQREALDAIAIKVGRILSGNANHVDHWLDITGYAQLVILEINRGVYTVSTSPSPSSSLEEKPPLMPTFSLPRLLFINGPAGSGKTTLGQAIRNHSPRHIAIATIAYGIAMRELFGQDDLAHQVMIHWGEWLKGRQDRTLIIPDVRLAGDVLPFFNELAQPKDCLLIRLLRAGYGWHDDIGSHLSALDLPIELPLLTIDNIENDPQAMFNTLITSLCEREGLVKLDSIT